MYGLNQTEDEKRNQVLRYSCVAQRDAEFISSDTITCVQCLTLGQPFVLSYPTAKNIEENT